MSCKLARLVVATSVAASLGITLTGRAGAAGHDIDMTSDDASKCDKKYGPPCFAPGNGNTTTVSPGDTVTWSVKDGTHTVTPVDPKAFQGSEDLHGPDGSFSVTFEQPGLYTFYCTHHGSVDKDGKNFHGMWGKIEVEGASPETTTTTTPEPTTTTTMPAQEPPAAQPPASQPPPTFTSPPPEDPAASEPPDDFDDFDDPPPPPAPALAPAAAPARAPAPAPTAKAGKAKKSERDGAAAAKEESTTTTTQPPAALPPTFELGPLSTDPAPPAPPPPAPHGNAVAVLDHQPARRGTKAIIITGVAVAALAIGGAGWKYVHRSSKYWPA